MEVDVALKPAIRTERSPAAPAHVIALIGALPRELNARPAVTIRVAAVEFPRHRDEAQITEAVIIELDESGLDQVDSLLIPVIHLGDTPPPYDARSFGHATSVVSEFTQQAPGRRAARLLLATGPAVGACWAAALVLSRAWLWPVPAAARLGAGTVLLLAVLALAAAAASRHRYRRIRLTAAASPVILVLDATAVTAVLLAAPVLTWALRIAATASLTRDRVHRLGAFPPGRSLKPEQGPDQLHSHRLDACVLQRTAGGLAPWPG